MESLQKAVKAGWSDAEHTSKDPDLTHFAIEMTSRICSRIWKRSRRPSGRRSHDQINPAPPCARQASSGVRRISSAAFRQSARRKWAPDSAGAQCGCGLLPQRFGVAIGERL